MQHIARIVLVFCIAAASLIARAADVKPTQEWKGSVADEKLMAGTPECIVTAKGFESLWSKWKKEGKPPEVDFDKQLLVITMSSGSQLNLIIKLDDKGDLKVLGMGTFDLRPGFRYVIGAIPKDGVKTVNGKALPKE